MSGRRDLEEEGGGRLDGVLVEDGERDEVCNESEDADETVDVVDDELVQPTPGRVGVELRQAGTRRRSRSDVVNDVTI